MDDTGRHRVSRLRRTLQGGIALQTIGTDIDKLVLPDLLPLLIDMKDASLMRYRRREQNDWAEQGQALDQGLRRLPREVLRYLQAHGEIEFSVNPKRTFEIIGAKLSLRDHQEFPVDIVSIHSEHILDALLLKGGQPCADATPHIHDASGLYQLHHHRDDLTRRLQG